MSILKTTLMNSGPSMQSEVEITDNADSKWTTDDLTRYSNAVKSSIKEIIKAEIHASTAPDDVGRVPDDPGRAPVRSDRVPTITGRVPAEPRYGQI
jgi:hypothetical protein